MEEAVLSESVDGTSGLTIECPEGWQQVDDVLGSLVAFIGPAADDGAFSPNVNVVVDADATESLEDIRRQHAAAVLPTLTAPRLIDEGLSEVGGLAASRLLIAHVGEGEDLTLEQWVVPLKKGAVVISATVATSDYQPLLAVLSEIVAGIRFDA